MNKEATGFESNPRLSNSGARCALSFVEEVVSGKRQAVTFYRDKDGTIRELGTKKEIDVRYLDNQ